STTTFRCSVSGGARSPGASPAVSSRCSPSPVRSCCGRGSCSWTSPHSGSRRSSSARSSASSVRSTARSASASCSSSRTWRRRSTWRTMPTSSRPAASSCRARPPSSAGTTPSDARISDTEPMEIFLQQVVSGLATGGIYGSVALALVMIYQATDVVNFAQGEMAMFSTYLAWSMLNAGVPYWAAFFATLAVAFVCGVVIERVVIRPVENAPVLTIVIVCIGLLVILNSVAGWIYSYIQKPFPSPFPEKPITIGNVFFGAHDLGALGVTLLVLLFLYVFFRYTTLGLAMRAAAQNPVSSRLCGIRVGWMLALGWGLAALVGAVAGLMIAPIVFLDPTMMSGILIYAFASATLGGFTSPGGAARPQHPDGLQRPDLARPRRLLRARRLHDRDHDRPVERAVRLDDPSRGAPLPHRGLSLRNSGAPPRGTLPRARDLRARPRRTTNLEVFRALDGRLAGHRAVEARRAARSHAEPGPMALLRHARRADLVIRPRGESPAGPDGAGDRRDPRQPDRRPGDG